MKFIFFIFFFFCFIGLQAQTIKDSTNTSAQSEIQLKSKTNRHSPKKATLLSLFIPGAGQVYNKKNWWWKIPIIYGTCGSLLYAGNFYQNQYNYFRLAYAERLTKGVNIDPYYNRYQTPTLQVIRDSYRDSRDQSYMWFVLVYAIQVLDATVEAHFVDFNMNENVSLKIQPQINMVGLNYTGGLQLTLKF